MAGGSAKSTNKARKDAKRPSRNKSPETESEATNLSEEIGKKASFCGGYFEAASNRFFVYGSTRL